MASSRRLAVVLVLVLGYMVAEVVGGLLTNSLALLADAGHMLSDAGALALSLFALWIARRPPTSTHTYGFYRTEILAALVNGAALVAISIYVFAEAFRRIGAPPEIEGRLMMVITAGGLAVNLAGLWLLSAGRSDSLNVRGAWLHVLTDALGSVGTKSAQETTLILLLSFLSGILSVTISSSSLEFSIFSYAPPERIACVHIALTLSAPLSIIISAAFASVPPVSTISSTSITLRPLTSPISSIVSITLACFLCL
jgi:cation diffusion facilitator family transporter